MAWYPYSIDGQVLKLLKVPRMGFAQPSISFSVLKRCYQNIQEVLQGPSMLLEMRLTQTLGESIYH